MEFQKIVAFRGPNIWAKSPVLEAWVDLGELKDSPSNSIAGFNGRLMSWLPGMIEHECSLGHRGGFFERLRRGTYLAHILEHVTLELQHLAGAPSNYGRARETTTEGVFRVAFKYEDEAIARACLDAGRTLCLAAVFDRPYDRDAEVHRLRTLADDVRLGPSTRAVVSAARERGIPVRRLSEGSLVQLGHGARQHRIHRSATDRTTAVAEAISDDKELTKLYLRAAGVPVARGRIAHSPADAWLAAQELGGRVVVKPRDCNFGNGVVIGISKREQIEGAYENARPQGSGVMVEQLAPGSEHRLLVVAGKFVAATRGDAASVIADGRRTIAQLVDEQLNTDPRRGEGLECPLAKVEFDPTVLLTLEQEGYTPESIPPAGDTVIIQRNGNLATDETDLVHESVRRHAETAARVIGLDVAGVDIIACDISQPLETQGGVVIEINASPGLQMHVAPASGQARPAGEQIVATMFAPGDTGRIPLVAVVGSSGTGEVTALLGRLFTTLPGTTALADAHGLHVGGETTRQGDCRDADSARDVLLNPLVDRAVFEMSLDRIANEGIGFDRCQVAVMTEIGPGMRLDVAEWDTPEKQVLVHRTVSDVVLPGGAVVVAADEPLLNHVADHCAGALVLVSEDGDSTRVKEHRAGGGKVVYPQGKQIVLADGKTTAIVPWNGAGPASRAALFAIAAAWCVGMSAEQIAAGLNQEQPVRT